MRHQSRPVPPASAQPQTADELHLYRIVQEALSNAAKHGAARKATIVLHKSPYALSLTVTDNGQGLPFSFQEAPDARGMGLDSMRYRARALGGELTIDSCPNEGTIVACEIPKLPSAPSAP